MQGAGAAGPGRGCHRREKVGRVRAAVARQQSHRMVVLRCQTRVRRWSRRKGQVSTSTMGKCKERWAEKEKETSEKID